MSAILTNGSSSLPNQQPHPPMPHLSESRTYAAKESCPQGANDDVMALIDVMRRGVEAAPAVYRPGRCWDQIISAHLEALGRDGIENFKRTLANNYFNWISTSPFDGLIRHAVASWVVNPTLGPLSNRFETPPTGLRDVGHPDSFSLSKFAGWRYKFFVGAVWEAARRADTFGLTKSLSEPTIGNPLSIWHRGRRISQDLANSIIELMFVAPSGVVRAGARIAELGAGYGRLAYVFAEAARLTYCIFDVPPALAVAQWYLTSVLGEDRVVPYDASNSFASVERRLVPGVVAFFTPDQIETFPDRWFDCVQTISTLPEMPGDQATHYLHLFSVKSAHAIFLKQWRAGNNAADSAVLEESDYRFEAPWQLVARRNDPIQPRFFNQLWLHHMALR